MGRCRVAGNDQKSEEMTQGDRNPFTSSGGVRAMSDSDSESGPLAFIGFTGIVGQTREQD
jgi:hypothetical protein